MREVFVLLACLLFSVTGTIQGDAIKEARVRHLFVQRHSPLPGAPRKLFKLEHETLDNLESSGGEDVHKLFSRVRRSVNPDMKPKVNEVSPYAVV